MDAFISILGIFVLLGIAYLLSNNRKAIRVRTVFGALAIQIAIGAFILYVPIGRDSLLGMSNAVSKVIAYANEGISFVFGGLASGESFFLCIDFLALLYRCNAMGHQINWRWIAKSLGNIKSRVYVCCS